MCTQLLPFASSSRHLSQCSETVDSVAARGHQTNSMENAKINRSEIWPFVPSMHKVKNREKVQSREQNKFWVQTKLFNLQPRMLRLMSSGGAAHCSYSGLDRHLFEAFSLKRSLLEVTGTFWSSSNCWNSWVNWIMLLCTRVSVASHGWPVLGVVYLVSCDY